MISNEEAAQIERLRYILAHGVKEGLVESPASLTPFPAVPSCRLIREDRPWVPLPCRMVENLPLGVFLERLIASIMEVEPFLVSIGG